MFEIIIKDFVSDDGVRSKGLWLNVDGQETPFIVASAIRDHTQKYRDALLAIRDNTQGMLNAGAADQETQDTAEMIVSLCDGVLNKSRAGAK